MDFIDVVVVAVGSSSHSTPEDVTTCVTAPTLVPAAGGAIVFDGTREARMSSPARVACAKHIGNG